MFDRFINTSDTIYIYSDVRSTSVKIDVEDKKERNNERLAHDIKKNQDQNTIKYIVL